jgi:hypothetical protein
VPAVKLLILNFTTRQQRIPICYIKLLRFRSPLSFFASSRCFSLLCISTFRFPLLASSRFSRLHADNRSSLSALCKPRHLPLSNTPISASIVNGIPVKNGHKSRYSCPRSRRSMLLAHGGCNHTHLLKSRESIISRCFSRSALVASSPASFNSSSTVASTGFHCMDSPRAPPSSTPKIVLEGANGISPPIEAF